MTSFYTVPQPIGTETSAMPTTQGAQPEPKTLIGTVNYHPIQDEFIGPPGKLRLPHKNEKIWITKQGQLVRKEKGQYYNVGNIDDKGNFAFNTGFNGNVFTNAYFRVASAFLQGPLGEKLRKFQMDKAKAASELGYIRQNLTQHGIDGRGAQIYCFEMASIDDDGFLDPSSHLRVVKATTDKLMAPSVKSTLIGFTASDFEEKDDVAHWFTQTEKSMAEDNVSISQAIANISHTKQPNQPTIINMSMGNTLSSLVSGLYHELDLKFSKGNYLRPKMRDYFYGPNADKLEDKDKYNILFQKLKPWFDNNPSIQQSMHQYLNTVEQAAHNRVFITVSAANDHTLFPTGVHVPPGAEFNTLAMSPYVIAVGASNNNGTPGNYSDDWVSHFSSRGDGVRFNPDIATTGENVFLDQYHFTGVPSGAFDGTSFSGPITAATLAMMTQVSPHLTPHQAKQLLQQACTKNNTSVAETGAGIMDPVKAVRLAMAFHAQQNNLLNNAYTQPQQQALPPYFNQSV